MVTQVTDATFEKEVLGSEVPVLVDYWAEWCGPCKMIAPMLEESAAAYAGRLNLAKLNVDDATPMKKKAANFMKISGRGSTHGQRVHCQRLIRCGRSGLCLGPRSQSPRLQFPAREPGIRMALRVAPAP